VGTGGYDSDGERLVDEDVLFLGELVEPDAAAALGDEGEAADGDGAGHLVSAGEGAVLDHAADLATELAARRRRQQRAAAAPEAELDLPFAAPAPQARQPRLQAARVLLHEQRRTSHQTTPPSERASERRRTRQQHVVSDAIPKQFRHVAANPHE